MIKLSHEEAVYKEWNKMSRIMYRKQIIYQTQSFINIETPQNKQGWSQIEKNSLE